MKKIMFILMLFVLSFLVSCQNKSLDYEQFDGIIYELNDNKQSYTIIGTNDEAKSEIVLPNEVNGLPVTTIGEKAFYTNTKLETIVIASSIKIIEQYAFSRCSFLKNITFENNSQLSYLKQEAFSYCKSLINIDLPENLILIGDYAFRNCVLLNHVTLPNNLFFIGEHIFLECSCLGYNIFDNAKYLGNKDNPYFLLISAINKDITSCNIKEGTRFIYAHAFSQCTALAQINLPNTLYYIGERAFFSCGSLEEVFIPSSVYRIESFAFAGGDKLKHIYLENNYIPKTFSDDWFVGEIEIICNFKK